MTETGTLKDLNVQPGDVVECVIDPSGHEGDVYDIRDGTFGLKAYNRNQDSHRGLDTLARFRIISRATPTLLKDMSDEDAGKLLLAWHRGEKLQFWVTGEWRDRQVPSMRLQNRAYRIAPPEPVRGTVTLYGDEGLRYLRGAMHCDTQSITLPTSDGDPIPGVYRDDQGNEITMEKLT